MMWKPLAALCAMALAAGCSQQGAAEANSAIEEVGARTHPESGLRVVPLTITSANGPHTFQVEVASTAQQQQKGLMFRTALGPDEGMIFPNSPPAPRSFWMKNTVIPLDLIFIGPDRRVLNIEQGQPYSLEPIVSRGTAIAVLELAEGRAAELGIGEGAAVAW